MSRRLRAAESSDAEVIQAIETAADALLIDALGAWDWPPVDAGAGRLSSPGFVLIAEDSASNSPIGFVHVLDIDGLAHLEQLSVTPAAARNGHGRALVTAALDEARERGYTRLTLRTYAEIPWNAPFYASCGFLESIPETAFLRELVETESALGLDRYGRRVQMTVEL
ncbi:GNAT family N-acetyltransferase [Microbacterium sp.]|uniref:GNAT family N-acetyltransferase n=1 Tax=Microbacterium sp. TaxID=51671 RepID=UPI002FE13527